MCMSNGVGQAANREYLQGFAAFISVSSRCQQMPAPGPRTETYHLPLLVGRHLY